MTAQEQALELCYAIEEAGASEQLTKCSMLASALRQRLADTSARAAAAYNAYCDAVGGVAFNGDKLPDAIEFFLDPSKQKQATAWLAAAAAI